MPRRMKPDEIVAAIIRQLEIVRSYSNRRPAAIGEDFYQLVEQLLVDLPARLQTFAETGHCPPVPPTAPQEHHQHWQHIQDTYDTTAMEALCAATQLLIASGEHGEQDDYPDLVGRVFEEWSHTHSAADGQYWTPPDLGGLLAQLIQVDPVPVILQRIGDALSSHAHAPLWQAMGLNLYLPHTQQKVLLEWAPELLSTIPALTIYDPTCGSGALLLAAAARVPRWMLLYGLVRVYGQELERTAYRLARINLMNYGFYPYGLQLHAAMYALFSTRQPTPAAVQPPQPNLQAAAPVAVPTMPPLTRNTALPPAPAQLLAQRGKRSEPRRNGQLQLPLLLLDHDDTVLRKSQQGDDAIG